MDIGGDTGGFFGRIRRVDGAGGGTGYGHVPASRGTGDYTEHTFYNRPPGGGFQGGISPLFARYLLPVTTICPLHGVISKNGRYAHAFRNNPFVANLTPQLPCQSRLFAAWP
jgi:hypothetical protein